MESLICLIWEKEFDMKNCVGKNKKQYEDELINSTSDSNGRETAEKE